MAFLSASAMLLASSGIKYITSSLKYSRVEPTAVIAIEHPCTAASSAGKPGVSSVLGKQNASCLIRSVILMIDGLAPRYT